MADSIEPRTHQAADPLMSTYCGIYRDNGKENGNYYNGLYRVIYGYIEFRV